MVRILNDLTETFSTCMEKRYGEIKIKRLAGNVFEVVFLQDGKPIYEPQTFAMEEGGVISIRNEGVWQASK